MSVRSRGRRKLREVAEYARREGWEVVMVTELRAQEDGVVWLGQDEEAVVLVHSARAGLLLRGELMKAWSDEGMRRGRFL